MRYSSQVRAARALLGWSQGKLARMAGVGLATLQRIEQREGVVKGTFPLPSKYKMHLKKPAFSSPTMKLERSASV